MYLLCGNWSLNKQLNQKQNKIVKIRNVDESKLTNSTKKQQYKFPPKTNKIKFLLNFFVKAFTSVFHNRVTLQNKVNYPLKGNG